LSNISALLQAVAAKAAPPPRLNIADFADEHRILSRDASAEPGKWRTERTAYMREPMAVLNDPTVHTVVVMSSAQVGKTEYVLNVLLYYMAAEPSAILVVNPTVEMAENFSRTRLAPMLRDCPILSDKVSTNSRGADASTLLFKQMPGGYVAMAGANSPSSLASRPVRIVLGDEIDRWPVSAGAEGDPVNLARARQKTFYNKKTILVSTPTIKGVSRIETAYLESDQRRLLVPCPDCGAERHLEWKNVHWPSGRPEEACYACPECGSTWDDATRWRQTRKARWEPQAAFNGTAGFHLNEIASPWVRLADMARNFLAAKNDPEQLKVFVNVSLGESFEVTGEKVDSNALESRVENWGEKAPQGVLVVTAGIDVQDDRIECERVGWGVEEESWSLDYTVIYGDPSGPNLWAELDAYLAQTTATADGRTLALSASAIDSGGHHTQAVYRFCKERARKRVWAIKGMSGKRPVWPPKASKNNIGKVNLFLVGVDSAKDSIYSRLRITEPGPGYIHLPKGRDPSYFAQLTAETVVTKYVKGFPTRVWQKRPGARNEALDCRVYAYAALQSLNVKWSRELEKRSRHVAPAPEPVLVADITDPLQAPATPPARLPAPAAPVDAHTAALRRLGARRGARPGYR